MRKSNPENDKPTFKYYPGTFESGDRLQADAIPIVLYRKIYFEYVGDSLLSYKKNLIDNDGQTIGELKIESCRPKIKVKYGFTIESGEVEIVSGYELENFPKLPILEVIRKIDNYDKFVKEFENLGWKPTLVQKVFTDGVTDYVKSSSKEKVSRASLIKMVNEYHERKPKDN